MQLTAYGPPPGEFESPSLHHFMKSQLNVRVTPVCVDLIKLERKTIPGCASDGEAISFRAATIPTAHALVMAAAAKEPLFAAALQIPARK